MIGEMNNNNKIPKENTGESQNKETEKAIYFSNVVNCGGRNTQIWQFAGTEPSELTESLCVKVKS